MVKYLASYLPPVGDPLAGFDVDPSVSCSGERRVHRGHGRHQVRAMRGHIMREQNVARGGSGAMMADCPLIGCAKPPREGDPAGRPEGICRMAKRMDSESAGQVNEDVRTSLSRQGCPRETRRHIQSAHRGENYEAGARSIVHGSSTSEKDQSRGAIPPRGGTIRGPNERNSSDD